MNLDLPLMGSGFFQGDYWPPACDLLADEEVTAVLPQASVVGRRADDQELEILESRGVITARDARCEIDLDIPEAGLPTGDEDGDGEDEPRIVVSIEAAGTPEVADLNFPFNDEGDVEPVETTSGTCYPDDLGGTACLIGGVAFTVAAELPFQERSDDSWTSRYRVDGRTTTFSAAYDSDDLSAEMDEHRRFVSQHVEARLAEPILARLSGEAAPAAPPASGPSTTEHSPDLVSLGTEAPIVDPVSGERVGAITVFGTEVDPHCPDPGARPPENGHFVFVPFVLEVDAGAGPNVKLSGRDFRIEGPDGEDEVATTAAATSCFPRPGVDPLADVGPGQRYDGPLILDTSHPHGTLVFAPAAPATEITWDIEPD